MKSSSAKTTTDDFVLIQQYKEGNDDAFGSVVKKYYKRIYTHAVIKLKDVDLAQDIVQDTFLKAMGAIRTNRYKEEGALGSWLMRIASNLCIDHFRRVEKMPTDLNGDLIEIYLPDSELNREEQIIKSEIEKCMQDLIENLPSDQKEVIILRHYCSMSFKKIAQITGVSINTSLGRMRYALINLRKMISPERLRSFEQVEMS